MKNIKREVSSAMKKICLLAAFLTAGCLVAKAQILTPVHWSYAAKKISKTEAVVFLRASIDEGWHVYSQHVEDGGPVKTTFTFENSPDYSLAGETIEPKPITRQEKVFNNMNVSFFEHSVVFQQKIKLKKSHAVVKGTLNYGTCNDHQCLPPEDVEFSIAVK